MKQSQVENIENTLCVRVTLAYLLLNHREMTHNLQQMLKLLQLKLLKFAKSCLFSSEIQKNRSYFFIQYKASLVHMHYDIRVTKQTHTHNTYMIYMIMHMHILKWYFVWLWYLLIIYIYIRFRSTASWYNIYLPSLVRRILFSENIKHPSVR